MIFSFSLREKVPAEQGDEGLMFAARTSSVASRDTFSSKEKGYFIVLIMLGIGQSMQPLSRYPREPYQHRFSGRCRQSMLRRVA